MARPAPVFTVRKQFKLTPAQASRLARAAAREGIRESQLFRDWVEGLK